MLKRIKGVKWNKRKDDKTSSDWYMYMLNTTKVTQSILIMIGRTSGCDLIE